MVGVVVFRLERFLGLLLSEDLLDLTELLLNMAFAFFSVALVPQARAAKNPAGLFLDLAGDYLGIALDHVGGA